MKNTELLQAMHNHRKDPSDANLVAMQKELARAQFEVPVTARHREDKQYDISFKLAKDSEGRIYVTVFTDMKSLKIWNGGAQEDIADIYFRDIAKMTLNDENLAGIVVNVSTDKLVLSRYRLAIILKEYCKPENAKQD